MSVALLIKALSTAGTIGAMASNAAPSIISFIQSTMVAVEATGKTGEEKLAAVLNTTETFIKSLGGDALEMDFANIAGPIEAFVNDTVSIWNAAGVFVKAVVSDVEGVVKAVEGQ